MALLNESALARAQLPSETLAEISGSRMAHVSMIAARLALPALALLLFTAHAYRAFGPVPAFVALLVSCLLFVRTPWASRGLSVFLGFASLEWLRTLFLLTSARSADGLPWLRLAIILSLVIVLTLGALFALHTPANRRYFGHS